MLYAQKANVVTKIREDQIDSFVNNGYKVINEYGQVVRDTAPNNLPALQSAYAEHVAQINTLKAEVQRLKDELTRAQAIMKAQAVTESEEVVLKPKRTRKKASEE